MEEAPENQDAYTTTEQKPAHFGEIEVHTVGVAEVTGDAFLLQRA